MGDYVPNVSVSVNSLPLSNISPSAAGYVGGENLILDTFNSIGQIVSDHSLRVDSALTAAETLLTELGMPTGWTSALDDITIADVPEIDLSSFPVMTPISELPGYESISWIDQDTSLSSYTSDMWTTLINTLLDQINNGGTGIPTTIEDALHERNLEKQRIANERAYALGTSEISSRALSFPQYAMQALANQVSLEILKQEHDSTNAIEIFMAELAQKNNQFAIDKVVVLEGLLRTFWRDYNTLKLAAVDAHTKEVLGHIEAITKEREGILKQNEIAALVFKYQTESYKNWYDAISERTKALLQKSTLELQKVEAELKAKLDSFIAINSLREKIIATIGGVSANVMASGLNAENVSVGATVTSNKSIAEHYQHSESASIGHDQKLSDNHNTSHDGE